MIQIVAAILIVAQIELVAFWAVFPKSKTILRWPWALLLGAVLCFTVANGRALAIGAKIPARSPDTERLIVISLCLTIIVFLILKWKFCLRLEPPFDNGTSSRARYDTIELIACVSLTALALIVIRKAIMIKPERGSPWIPGSEYFEISGADFFFVSFFSWTVVCALPSIYAAFRHWDVKCVALWLVATIPVSIVELVLLQWFGGWVNWPKSLFIMYAVNTVPSIVFYLVLWRLDAFGFRLERRGALRSESDSCTRHE